MDFSAAPEPGLFTSQIAELHRRGTSPNGMFGFPVSTVCGKMERTVVWEKSWAKSFTHQLKDVIRFDNETNGPWPEYDAACKQLIDVAIPRLLGALQSDGREITPALIHGDLWERNIGIDWKRARLLSSILGPHTPITKWNSEHGDAPGRFTSIHRSTCDSINAITNPQSLWKNGTTVTGFTASIRI